MAAPRVISNSSTFRGFLEANGLDDMILNPCGCIFGDSEDQPSQIPIPGQRKYANQRPASVRGRGGGGRNGQRHGGSVRNGGRGLSRQQSVMSKTSMQGIPEDGDYAPESTSKSPFSVLFGAAFAGASTPMGGPSGNSSTENMNGDAKPTNSKLSFWNNRSISLMDMYGTDSNDEKCGEINFGLDYDFGSQTLKLKIIQGKDLAAKDTNGLSDPYVRVTLLPDKKQRLDTKIKRRTLNPRWNETIYFEGFPINKLQSRVLHLHVYDYDRFSRDDSIGEFHLPLCQVDFTSKPTYWKQLYPPIKAKLGELLVSLTYHPAKNTLTIFVMKAKNLKAKDINGKSDPYVKVWLMFGDKRVEKKKTPVYKCNLNPIFNATFEFDVPWEQIRDCALDVTVMDFDTVGRNELIGKLILGSKNGSGATETKQWQDMIAKPRQSVVVWHRLKPGE